MDTKHCRSCCEEINAAATKCPHCQAFQSRWMPWLYIVPGLLPLLLILPLIIFPFSRLRTDSTDVEFKDVQHQLTISNARLKYEEPPNQDGVTVHQYRRHAWLYCTIKNDSDYRWENLEFLVEFENADGERLDVDNVSAAITSQPHSDLEFRLACELAIDPNDVAKTKITVTDARRPYR